MKSYFLIFILIFFSVYALSQKVKLNIEINGLKSSEGNIIMGIYDNSKSFPKKGKALYDLKFKAISPTTTYSIELPKGLYAICVCHDKNSNGDCDTNFFGIPTEPYGFSNNVKPLLSAPSFSSASFNLNYDKTISIILIH